MRTIFGGVQVIARILFHSPTHRFRVLSCAEPYFPAASIRLHRQYVSRMNIHEDSFLQGTVPYFVQKPIALFRRFAFFTWNSLFLIAITLIVSVTAPRRVPRTGRMSLLIPLDSPLSQVSFGFFAIPFQNRKGLRLSCKAPALLSSGVCPFLFCDIIISSILHNVNYNFPFFHINIVQINPALFSVFPSFQAHVDLL